MKRTLTIFAILASATLAQYNKVDVSTYYKIMPLEYLEEFIVPNAGESYRYPLDVLFVDNKNSYISLDRNKVKIGCLSCPDNKDLFSEFVVWKQKYGNDEIIVSGRLNFANFRDGDSVEYNKKLGVHQAIAVYRFDNGDWQLDMDFLPTPNTIVERASKKYPELLSQKKSWRFAYILPRVGSTIRLVLYIVTKVNGKNKVLMKDVYKIIWDGLEFKLQPK